MFEDVYANENDSDDTNEYTQVLNSSTLGYSGIVVSPETIQASFDPVIARFVKMTFAEGGRGIDEVEIFAPAIPVCDFDENLLCNVNDINLMFMQGDLVVGVQDADGASPFNLNGDTVINNQDINQWLAEAVTENGFDLPFVRGDTDDLDQLSPARRDVDITDFNALASNFAPQGTPSGIFAKNWHLGNFDGDADVDITDFNFLAGNYEPNGYGAGQAGTAPEPTTSLLLAIGGLFIAAAGCARWSSRCAGS